MIVKAIKKPVIIKFEKFNGTSENAKTKEEDGVYKIFIELHNSWVELKIGDYINIEKPEDNYPVDADYFKENYEIVHENEN